MNKKALLRIDKFLLLALAILAMTASIRAGAEGDDPWTQGLLLERAAKDVEFKTSPTSPMAGRERLTLPAGAKAFITVSDNSVAAAIADSAATAFSLLCRDGRWYWDDPGEGVVCSLGSRPVARGSETLVQGCQFRAGRLTLSAYPGAENLALIVFDPQRPQILLFERLLYYPPDAKYAVQARLERFPEMKPLKVTTTRRLEKTFYRYGKLRFKVAGRELELTALKTSLEGADAKFLFVPFKDATNGEETYEVGRFIDLEEPEGNDVILDFNRCYNPLCNYSPAYNCPLPPLENILEVEIKAGEKTYPH